MLARFTRRRSLALLAAVAAVIATSTPAWAPPGDLDPTFGNGGKVVTDFGFEDEAFALALQGNGQIIAAGSAADSGGMPEFFALTRYNVDGSLDFSFGGIGQVFTDVAPGHERAHAVIIQADGKIVAAGFAIVSGTYDFALARYNTDGSLDPTFDGDGTVTTDFAGNDDRANAVAIQGDGKIIAAGEASFENFALARYNTDGSLDTTFDGDGKVITDFAGDEDRALGMAIQGDGNIVAAGLASVAGGYDFGLARYNTDGSLDPTFDGDGTATTDFGNSSDQALGVAVQGDQKIVTAGFAASFAIHDFAIARYTTGGSLDPTFDGDGKLVTDFAGSTDEAHDVAIQADGMIVAAGYADISPGPDFALARYKTNGSLDTLFSGDGKVSTDFNFQDRANAIAIQADRKILAAGVASDPGTLDNFALARYTVCRRTSRPSSSPFCP